MANRKLSASAISTFLRSPKAYYWRYVAKLDPIQPSIATFDHDKMFGVLWAAYVDRFYKGESEEANVKILMEHWLSQSEGWVPEKMRDAKTRALEALAPQYYQQFSPDDGARMADSSEMWIENETFCGRLDGYNPETDCIHECKTTSRSPQLSEQLWKIQNSIQVKLYCVLTDAVGHIVEIAFKDSPYQIFRAPEVSVTAEQKRGWKQELEALAERIYSLGDNPNNYACNTDSCCLVTRGMVSMCAYQTLCSDGLTNTTSIFFKNRTRS